MIAFAWKNNKQLKPEGTTERKSKQEAFFPLPAFTVEIISLISAAKKKQQRKR